MQKKIIALAVAGLVSGAAFAQSNVTIYGNLDLSYLNATRDSKLNNVGAITKYDAKQTSTGFESGALTTNHIGFKGSEDLGNGLKATFQLELGLNENDTAPIGAAAGTAGNRLGVDSANESNGLGAMAIRKQNIGLQGGFGTFVIGRQATLMDDAWAVASVGGKNNAIGDLYSHMAEQSTNRVALRTQPLDTYHDVRVNEVMTYVSPNFSGFTLAAQYGKGKTDVSNNAAGALTGADYDHVNYGASANYANGPITAVFAYNNEKNDAMTTTAANKDINSSAFDRSSWLLAGTYNFGVVKVYGQWFDGERDGDAYTVAGAAPVTKRSSDMRGWELGLSAPITAQLTLLGSYYDTTNDRTDTAVATGVRTKYSADGNGYQLAAVYALSKRTAAYAAYGHETIDLKQKGAAYKDSADGRDFAVGIKHSF